MPYETARVPRLQSKAFPKCPCLLLQVSEIAGLADCSIEFTLEPRGKGRNVKSIGGKQPPQSIRFDLHELGNRPRGILLGLLLNSRSPGACIGRPQPAGQADGRRVDGAKPGCPGAGNLAPGSLAFHRYAIPRTRGYLMRVAAPARWLRGSPNSFPRSGIGNRHCRPPPRSRPSALRASRVPAAFEHQSIFELPAPTQLRPHRCRHVLHSIPHPDRVIAELVRVTRPGGYLHLIAEDYGMLHFQRAGLDPRDSWHRVAPSLERVRDRLFIGRDIFGISPP